MLKQFLILFLSWTLTRSDTSFIKAYDFSNFTQKVYLDSSNQTLTIAQDDGITNFATYLGKGFINVISSFRNITFPLNMTMKFDTTENLQFFIYYTNFPPSQAPLIPATVNWTYYFSASSNFYQLFPLMTTSSSNSLGETGNCSFYQKVVSIIVPKNAISLLNKRISDLNSTLNTSGLSGDDLTLAYNNLNNVSIFFQTLNITESNDQTAQTTQSNPPSSTTFTTSPFELLNDNDIIYSYSDESSHFWMNSMKNTLFIIDAGSQLLANNITNTMNTVTTLKYVKIFVTHCHYDHLQSLATFIYKNSNSNISITLYISNKVDFQLTGWLLESFPFIVNSSNFNSFLFKLYIVDPSTSFSISESNVYAQAILHNYFPKNDVKHFITSTTWVFYEDGKCTKVFSGDINPPSPKPNNSVLETDVQNYFEQVYQKIDRNSSMGCLNYFWDYGHFLDITENYSSILLNFNKTNSNGLVLNSSFYYEHMKNASGFAIYKIGLPLNLSSSLATLYYSPPAYVAVVNTSSNGNTTGNITGSFLMRNSVYIVIVILIISCYFY